MDPLAYLAPGVVRVLAFVMDDMRDLADTRLTLRLSSDLDRGMRDSAAFFGRSVGAEWRVAARLYRRVLLAWSAIAAGAVLDSTGEGGDDRARDGLLLELCAGLVQEPKPLEALRSALKTNGESGTISEPPDAPSLDDGCSAGTLNIRMTADCGDRHEPQ